ncbi:phosphoglycerate mutase family protein [Thalassotalea euphylliae]|uniref:phosphoglycerate mutase family protein n=1 Tax=Thalassotalea euphylliae TaxID=1655234 RepID=UPI00362B5110
MEIVFIRHGEPASNHNNKLTSKQYKAWVEQYNASSVADTSRPNDSFTDDFANYFVVSSSLQRAIESCEIYTKQSPQLILDILNEMDIPFYTLPLKLKAWTWLYLSRVLWTFGVVGKFECYLFARQRAKSATVELQKIAEKHDKLLVFGHGYMNAHIRRLLVRNGWTMESKNNHYWGVTRLTKTKQG